MIEISRINVVNNLSLDYLLIQIICKPTSEDLTDYVFDIYRNTSLDGEYELIASDIDSFQYADRDVNLYKQSIKYYYKVKVKNIKTLEEEFSTEIGELSNHIPDNIANSVAIQYDIYLDRVVSNPKVYLLSRKRFGQKCAFCYDEIRMQAKNDNCPHCYTTGYMGGYHKPIKIPICYMSNKEGLQQLLDISNVGEVSNPIQAWVKNYPIVQPGDIIVDDYNRRFEVINWQPTTKNNFILRQVLTLQKLPHSNIIYKFPIREE